MCLGNDFFQFFVIGKNLNFHAFSAKIFKNKKKNKKVKKKKHSLSICIKMVLKIFGDFCQKIFSLTLFKNFGAKYQFFKNFSKNAVFSQKSYYLNRFLVKFPF